MNYIYILFLFQLPLSVCKKYRIKTNPGKINIIVEIGHNIIPKGSKYTRFILVGTELKILFNQYGTKNPKNIEIRTYPKNKTIDIIISLKIFIILLCSYI